MKEQKNGRKPSVAAVRHTTLPFRHIKATMRTGKTGKERAFFHIKTREIFWQSVSGKLHFRPNIMAKSKTKLFSTIRKSAGIPLAGWQGIMAKPADNCDKAHSGRRKSRLVFARQKGSWVKSWQKRYTG